MATKEWAVVAVTLGLSAVLWNTRGRAPRTGDLVDAAITVVPNDRHELECALSRSVGRYRCGYADAHTAAAAPQNEADVLRPYLTTSRVLFLVPGLFEVPAIERFVTGLPTDRRFVARCKVRLIEQVSDAQTRFRRKDAMTPAAVTWVAEAVSCEPE